MQITWYGHSCFLLSAESGVSILTDPCDPTTGYALHDIRCDAVTVSHDHHDHNCLDAAAGNPQVVRATGAHTIGDVRITGYATFHDDAYGARRGANVVFAYEIDELRLVHLGDLGHMLGQAAIDSLGRVDVLLAPVGGTYTIDSDLALRITEALQPRVLIPMHFKTPALRFDIDGIEPLLAASARWNVHRLNSDTCTLTRDTLGERRLLLLDYKR